MGDIRFTMIGVALVFAGFITLGVFGGEYQSGSIEAEEFDTCYRYSDDAEPVKVSCAAKIGEQAAFFGVVISLIAAGVASLIKGARGNWDSKVGPGEKVGPDRRGTHDGNDHGARHGGSDSVK